jgi:hypothetical protein
MLKCDEKISMNKAASSTSSFSENNVDVKECSEESDMANESTNDYCSP